MRNHSYHRNPCAGCLLASWLCTMYLSKVLACLTKSRIARDWKNIARFFVCCLHDTSSFHNQTFVSSGMFTTLVLSAHLSVHDTCGSTYTYKCPYAYSAVIDIIHSGHCKNMNPRQKVCLFSSLYIFVLGLMRLIFTFWKLRRTLRDEHCISVSEIDYSESR